ncbi:MAG: alpha-hydroxy acid oxidase, partial [Thermoplasmata archaeon]
MGEPSFRTLRELEELATARLTDRVGAYIQGGSGTERTLRANHAAFLRWSLEPRVLTDVSTIDLRTTLLGRPVAAPIFVAPMAYHGEVHADGETAVARAAGALDLLSTYSTLTTRPLEEIASANGGGARWFQLYPQSDPEIDRALAERARRAGYAALVVTVDAPILAVRDRQAQGGFAIDASVPIGNGARIVPPPRAPRLDGSVYRIGAAPSATWATIDRIRDAASPLPIVLKGILTAEDTRRAIEHEAQAVIVSNHGGRQLDGAPAALDALPGVVRAASGQIEVLVDGGVRRASDVLIALALG